MERKSCVSAILICKPMYLTKSTRHKNSYSKTDTWNYKCCSFGIITWRMRARLLQSLCHTQKESTPGFYECPEAIIHYHFKCSPQSQCFCCKRIVLWPSLCQTCWIGTGTVSVLLIWVCGLTGLLRWWTTAALNFSELQTCLLRPKLRPALHWDIWRLAFSSTPSSLLGSSALLWATFWLCCLFCISNSCSHPPTPLSCPWLWRTALWAC